MKASVILVVYALGLVLGGVYAYASAPAGANAKTALIVPAACAAVVLLCAAMAAVIAKNRRVGMIGIHLGLVLPLLFAAVFAHRAWKTHQAVTAYQQVVQGASPPGAAATSPAVDHDKTYLRNTLVGLGAWSVLAFGAMLAARPKRSERVA